MIALLSALATVGVVAVTVGVALLAQRLGGAPSVRAVLLALPAPVVALAAWALHLTSIAAPFAAPIAALAWLFGVLVAVARTDARHAARAIVVAVLTAAVFLPVASVVLSLDYDPFGTGIGFIDLGWALPALVAGGAAGIAGAVAGRGLSAAAIRWREVALPLVLLWAGGVLWLYGISLEPGEGAASVVLNAVLMPAIGCAFWAIVERARRRTNTPAGVLLGLLAGLAAAAPAAGNVIPLLGGLIAAVAGAVGALLPWRRRLAGPARVAVTVLGGAGISIVLLGALGRDVAFIYTGQPEVLFTQVASLLLAAVGGFAIGLVAWIVAGAVRRPRAL
jgi:ammonia channel protein AmtB